MVKENILHKETIDRINESTIPDWPGGRRPYLLGSILMQEMLSANNEPNENIYHLNQRYSRRFPYFITGPVEDLTGFDWSYWLTRSYSKIEKAANYQLKSITSNKQKNYTKYNFNMDSQFSPSFSPDGRWLAFIAGNYYDGFGIYLSELPNGKAKLINSGTSIEKISWLPDSSGFVFSKQQPTDHYSLLADLFLYKVGDNQLKQLTFKARAIEPEVSTDGMFVYFIKSGDGRSTLSRYSFATSHIDQLWQTPINHRLYSPAAISQNKIAVGYRGTEGKEQLFLVNDVSEEKTNILNNFDSIRELKMTSQGLFFISDKSGVPNLYMVDKPWNNATPLTNSETGVLNADYSKLNKTLAISKYDKSGPQLYFTNNLQKIVPVEVPPLLTNTRVYSRNDSNIRYKLGNVEKEIDQLKVFSKNEYASTDYLIPQYWMPFIYPVEGGALIQASTSAEDPLQKQIYDLGLSYDTLSKDLSGAINYLNQMTRVGLGFGYGIFNEYRSASNQEITTESLNLSSRFHLSNDNAWNSHIGYTFAQTDRTSSTKIKRMGANVGLSYSSEGHFSKQPRDNVLSASLSYSKYFNQQEYISFDRVFNNIRFDLKKPLKSRHIFSSQIVNSYAHNMSLSDSFYIGDT
ncbi:MAG: PD40 domain-containing protein, partial [Bdellovibrionales bacterium]|nr:PD40 domain-containing protein [Bdellovibrionales bacterium]